MQWKGSMMIKEIVFQCSFFAKYSSIMSCDHLYLWIEKHSKKNLLSSTFVCNEQGSDLRAFSDWLFILYMWRDKPNEALVGVGPFWDFSGFLWSTFWGFQIWLYFCSMMNRTGLMPILSRKIRISRYWVNRVQSWLLSLTWKIMFCP